MRFVVPAVLALVGSTLATTGCADVATQQEVESVGDKIEKLSAKVAQQNEMHTLVVEEFRKQLGELNKQAAANDAILKALQANVARLEEEVKTLRAQALAAPAAAPAPGDPNPRPDAPRPLKLEEVLAEIEATLNNLRSGKLREDEAAARLKPFAKDAAPRLFQELRASITKFDYAKQLERILARFPAEDLKVPLREALTQHGARESAARVAGATRDPGLGKLLEEHAGTEDEDFRLILGDALAACRNPAGIPLLVRCLRSEQPATRTIAIAALKRLNRGDDLGYRAQLDPAQSAPAAKAWEDWADKYGKVIFD
jgi:hypothetical protein